MLHANWLIKYEEQIKEKDTLISLTRLLLNYPCNDYLKMATCLLEFSDKLKNSEMITDKTNLIDELKLLSLLHITHSFENERENTSNSDTKRIEIFFSICNYFNSRNREEIELKKRNEQTEAYKYKLYGQAKLKVEIDEDEYETMFPSFLSDFNEFHNTSILNESKKSLIEKDETIHINHQILNQVFTIISFIIENYFYKSERLDDSNKVQYENFFLKTFIRSYKLCSSLTQRYSIYLGRQDNSYVSHLIFSCLSKKHKLSHNEKTKGCSNIYKDSNIVEVLKCKQVLDNFKKRINVLLNEWPDNSILIELKKICERIESFFTKESIIKYLTGLELLMQKAQNWQIVASKEFNLDQELKEISSIVIEWRKLELDCWKQSLQLEEDSIEINCISTWFFHVFSVCVECLSDRADNFKNIFCVLNEFMRSSTIGEFSTRLEIIKMCSAICSLNKAYKDINSLDAFWNLYKYYSLFAPYTKLEIDKCKKKIEKELNDFVKICRWQDMNYWALKQSTDKSHRTIFKFIKNFKEFCNQNVVGFLTVKNVAVIYKETNFALLNKIKSVQFRQEGDAMATKYQTKCCKFMSKLIKQKELDSLDEIFCLYTSKVNEAHNSFNQELNNINSKKSSDEKLKEFKNLDLIRRKFLNDLFKQLSFLGLSYRKGNIEYTDTFSLEDYLHFSPLNLPDASFWESNENEYYLCVSRYLEFKAALNNVNQNSKSLTAIYQEKINGFLAHFMHIIYDQKKNLHSFAIKMKTLGSLNKLLAFISTAVSGNKSNEEISSNLKKIGDMVKNVLAQFEFLLISAFGSSEKSENILGTNNSIQVDSNLLLETITPLKKEIELMCINLKEYSLLSNETTSKFDFETIKFYFFSKDQERFFQKTKNETLKNLKTKLNAIIENIKNFEICKISKQIISDIEKIEEFFEKIKIKKTRGSTSIDKNELNFIFVEKMLKSVEDLYKKYFISNHRQIKEIDEFGFTKNILIEEFHGDLINDFERISLNSLNKNIFSTLTKIKNVCDDASENSFIQAKDNISKASSFTKIYKNFLYAMFSSSCKSHFNACKLLNELLDLFSDSKITSFQFEDIKDENTNDNQSTLEKDNETCGLGDGEGKKNVSDEIETEDQLEGTKGENDKNEEVEEITKEENGIEMSENFDANLKEKNIEEDQEDDEDGESRNENLEDELGDVDEDQAVLDEKLWDGSDDDDGDDDNDEGNKNNKTDNSNENLKQKQKSELACKNEDLPFENRKDNKKSDELDDLDDLDIDENFDDGIDDFENQINDKSLNEDKSEEKNETKIENVDEKEEIMSESDSINNEKDESMETSDNEIEKEQEENENSLQQKEDILSESKDTVSLDKKDAYNDGTDEKNFQESSTTNSNAVKQKDEKTQNPNEQKESEMLNDLTKSESFNADSITEKYSANEKKDEYSRKKTSENNERILGEQKDFDETKEGTVFDSIEEEKTYEESSVQENIQKDFKHLKSEEDIADAEMRDVSSQLHQKNENNNEIKNNEMNIDSNQTNKLEILEKPTNQVPKENFLSNIREKNDQKLDSQLNEKNDKNYEQKVETIEIQVDYTLHLDSTFCTNVEKFNINEARNYLKMELNSFLCKKSAQTNNTEAFNLWHKYEILTEQFSKELCEQIRLILEPTKCSKLKGDYKTGKRLNMRRVMEYIATEYRKDKIWLRRTKPSKRDYKVVLAIDNSSSMSDNHCMQLAYETVATLVNAFSYLQVGQFGLLSFGEETSILQPLQEHFNSNIGEQIFSKINFTDNKTKIAEVKFYIILLFCNALKFNLILAFE